MRLFMTSRLAVAIVAAAVLMLGGCATQSSGAPGSPKGAASGTPAGPAASTGSGSAGEVGAARGEVASPPPARPGAPVPAAAPLVAEGESAASVLPSGTATPSDALPTERSLQELERGAASWYGLQFHGRRTANGERFDMRALTAAHKTLPFGTRVRVRSLVNGREVDVRINDRGPYVGGRIIDLSHAATEALDMLGMGIKQVVLSSASPVVEPSPPRSRGTGRARAKMLPKPRARALPADPALR